MPDNSRQPYKFDAIKAFAARNGYNALTGSDAFWLICEVERLRLALRDVIFDLHNCEYGGDMPRCNHIGDALRIARATQPYDATPHTEA